MPPPISTWANLSLLTQQLDKGHQWVEQGLSKQPDSAFGHFLQGSLYAEAWAGQTSGGRAEEVPGTGSHHV